MNEKLKKEGYEVLCTDIQYKEGILEYLENNTKIDYIILNENIEGNIETQELIKEIKRIEKNIRVILVSNSSLDENKIIKNIENNNQKYNNQINNKKIKPEIKKVLNQKNIKFNLENFESEKLEKENKKIKSNYSIYNQKSLPINNFYSQKNFKNKTEIVSILGTNGIGKSVFSVLFAKNVQNKKTLIIDFDVLNNSLHTLLGVKKYQDKIKKNINKNDLINPNQKINKFIIKTNSKIDLLSGMNLILDPKYKLSYKKIKEIINELQEEYELIIFDTAPYNFFDYTKEIINISNQNIFISGANLLEIKKSERLLNIYAEDWNIDKNKIDIVFNKCTNKSIDDEILKEMFRNYNILGKIQLNDYYDLVINKNMDSRSKIHKEIDLIKKQIIKEKYSGIS